MNRVTTVRWRTPAPTSVDEELAVFDDGQAWLVVRCGSTDGAAVGTFLTSVEEAERNTLPAGDWTVDPLHPDTAGAVGAVTGVAGEIARRARTTPYAVARFHGRGISSGAGGVTIALAVVGEGAVAVAFELDPAGVTAQFKSGGSPLSWTEAGPLETGFVTPDAEGLGGLHRRAAVEPGTMGALMVPVTAPHGADEVEVQVRGWLVEAVPDAAHRQPFEARTDLAPIS